MSYYNDVYSSPEKHGLEILGSVNDWDACYSFDMIVVWRRKEDGALLYGTDSGCSCPSPFEDYDTDDKLTPLTDENFEEFKKELSAHCWESTPGNYRYRETDPAADDKADLIRKVHMSLREASSNA